MEEVFVLAGLIFVLLFLIRSGITHSVRIHFLLGDSRERHFYDLLPAYEAMLVHPMHWGRWTKAHWRAYAIQQEQA